MVVRARTTCHHRSGRGRSRSGGRTALTPRAVDSRQRGAGNATREQPAHHCEDIAVTRQQRQRPDGDSRARLGGASARPLLHVLRESHGRVHPARVRGRASPGPGRSTNRACCTCATPRCPGRSPDPKETLDDFYTHVASPEILVDDEPQADRDVVPRLVDQRRALARGSVAARAWAQKNGYSQFTQAAVSTDGLQFDARAGDHADAVPSRVPARRLLLRRLATRTTVAHRRIRSRVSNSVRIHSATGRTPDRIRHVALVQRGDGFTCSSPPSATRPSAC